MGSTALKLNDYDAVIFDLDGVLTNTARVHAISWKEMFDTFLKEHEASSGTPFVPFDAKSDYLQYVDGKPRYQGIESFLASRDISLPWGDPEDSPDAPTICGLANKKNRAFQSHLEQEGVDVFSTTVNFIEQLRAHGLKTGIISSSKNCTRILDQTDLNYLFDTKIDGNDAPGLGIKGKPAPDIFLRAAANINVTPERTAVVEDAISGVQAGKSGGFALVIGLDRGGHPEDLANNGADVVVQDLKEITLVPEHAQKALPEILKRIQNKTPVIFLDYDGTLTPIVKRPDLAVLSDGMRTSLNQLSETFPVAIISGRDRRDVMQLVGIDHLYYSGSHGFDTSGPNDMHVENEEGQAYLPVLDAAEKELHDRLDGIEGALIERKKFAIAVHFRLVADADLDTIETAVNEVHQLHPELRQKAGKKIFELQPNIPWDKGKAVLWLLDHLQLNRPDCVPFYIGDDTTDEDAFKVLIDKGIGIRVQEQPEETAARYILDTPDQVQEFLNGLIQHAQRK